MTVELKYGKGHITLDIPERAEASVLKPASVPVVSDLAAAFSEAMARPVGMGPLETLPVPRSVAIAVPDETRPVPVKTLLPLFLSRLYAAFPRLAPADVTVVIGAGLHPPLDEAGIRRVVPEASAPGVRVVSHDAKNSPMTDFGVTSRGTPVRINSAYAAADMRLVIGNIDPHQFQGFTGGAKGAVIGCGAAETIEANHALMREEGARVANLSGNAPREDIDEAGRMMGVHMVANTILDAGKRVARLLCGEPVAVYREGAKTCAAVYGVPIPGLFDIAVASCGGHPKDICLYQAQKGLAHAAQAVKPGGKILLLAACPDGVGDDIYEEYVSRFATPGEVIADFRASRFRMGAHKAFLFARTLVKHDVCVKAEIDPAALARCQLRACDPQETVNRWVSEAPARPRVAVISNANTTYFFEKK